MTDLDLRPFGLCLNDMSSTPDSNWQRCWYPPTNDDPDKTCLIQLEVDGPWWFTTNAVLCTKGFGAGMAPVDTEGFVGPFVFTSSEEAYATYILCGGVPNTVTE